MDWIGLAWYNAAPYGSEFNSVPIQGVFPAESVELMANIAICDCDLLQFASTATPVP